MPRPPRGASDDLKARVPILYREGYSVKDTGHQKDLGLQNSQPV